MEVQQVVPPISTVLRAVIRTATLHMVDVGVAYHICYVFYKKVTVIMQILHLWSHGSQAGSGCLILVIALSTLRPALVVSHHSAV